MFPRTVLLCSVVWGVFGCNSAPGNPTWTSDVKPIIDANCVRCHSSPASGGAPQDFRLDIYDDQFVDGKLVRGAASMAFFVVERSVNTGDMPPGGIELSGAQLDTLQNWLTNEAPLGTGNQAPTVNLVDDAGNLLAGAQNWEADQELVVRYFVSDPDGGSVSGSVFYVDGSETVVSRDLHDGFGTFTWDTSSVPDGTYTLLARLVDGSTSQGDEPVVMLGEVVVDHAGANLKPTVEISVPATDAIVHVDDSPIIRMSIDDAEADMLEREVAAVRGDEVIVLVNDTVAGDVGTDDVPFDLSNVPDGPNWRIRVTLTDAANNVAVGYSGLFIATKAQTSLLFADVEPILSRNCLGCHPVLIPIDLGVDGIAALAGQVYRRTVHLREMPPPSGATAFDIVMTDAERATLGEWLLGGAPLN